LARVTCAVDARRRRSRHPAARAQPVAHRFHRRSRYEDARVKACERPNEPLKLTSWGERSTPGTTPLLGGVQHLPDAPTVGESTPAAKFGRPGCPGRPGRTCGWAHVLTSTIQRVRDGFVSSKTSSQVTTRSREGIEAARQFSRVVLTSCALRHRATGATAGEPPRLGGGMPRPRAVPKARKGSLQMSRLDLDDERLDHRHRGRRGRDPGERRDPVPHAAQEAETLRHERRRRPRLAGDALRLVCHR
jgi:hypothetical protein